MNPLWLLSTYTANLCRFTTVGSGVVRIAVSLPLENVDALTIFSPTTVSR